MDSDPHVIWLQDCTHDCAALVGGKAAALGLLLQHGFRVPPGFAVTTQAYREHVAANSLADKIARLLAAGNDQRAAEDIRALFDASTPATRVADEVLAAHERLSNGTSLPMAVRSSATAEDLANASFAGQQDTYLWLLSGEEVLRHVVRCWGSLFTPQAISYRLHVGTPFDDLAMGVVVQAMVPAEAAGVMLTLDPISGDRSTIALEAAYGLGVAVVNGEVNPDRFCVSKSSLAIESRFTGDKHLAYRFDPAVAGTRAVPVPPAQQRVPCVTDAEVLSLAEMGRRMEQAMACPQDMEWCIGPEREIFLLQARPETVWSQALTARP
jgi:phosphoenolpyruvate synthase/pyruvate phosphate dikinase